MEESIDAAGGSGDAGRYGTCSVPGCQAIAVFCVVAVPVLLCNELGLSGIGSAVLCTAHHSIGCCAAVGCGKPIMTKMYDVSTYRNQIPVEISTEYGEDGWNGRGAVICWQCLYPSVKVLNHQKTKFQCAAGVQCELAKCRRGKKRKRCTLFALLLLTFA